MLFADLRGYSRYAEQHRPADVFRVLDAYANRASGIIRGHGGWVLSFHGDGLLAIFGALDPSEKERSARLARWCATSPRRVIFRASRRPPTCPYASASPPGTCS